MADNNVDDTVVESTEVEHASDAPRTTSSTRIYVGNLAYRVRWQGLKDHMRQGILHRVRYLYR